MKSAQPQFEKAKIWYKLHIFYVCLGDIIYIYTKITNIQGGVWGIHLANLRFTRIVMKVPCMILLTSLL